MKFASSILLLAGTASAFAPALNAGSRSSALSAKPKVFIDGEAGTTGIQVFSRLEKRDDLEIISPPADLRKDPATRKKFINDADAAGLAELHFGAAHNQEGVILMLTFGTGIGSALIVDGVLVPNSELGHLEYKGMKAEHYCSDRVRELEALSWKAWGKRVDKYLNHLKLLFSPDLFIIGGGVSKKHDKFFPVLDLHTRIVPAALRNEAGIIGVAGAAARIFADTNWQLAEEARLHTLQHTPPMAPVSQPASDSEPTPSE